MTASFIENDFTGRDWNSSSDDKDTTFMLSTCYFLSEHQELQNLNSSHTSKKAKEKTHWE